MKPREGIRLLELYEDTIEDRTYLQVRYEKPKRTPRKKGRSRRKVKRT